MIKQFNEQVQQINELFVNGSVKESYTFAKALLANELFTIDASFSIVQQHVALLEANGYANMPTPTSEKVKQSVERADGSYPERDVLAGFLGTQDDEQFGKVVDELLAGPIEAQANAYYTMRSILYLPTNMIKQWLNMQKLLNYNPIQHFTGEPLHCF